MKRITTPFLLGLFVGSLLLCGVLISLDRAANLPPPKGIVFDEQSTVPTARAALALILLVALLLVALAAFTVLVWRLMKRIGQRKFTLLCGAIAFVLCGLFPPWLKGYGSRAVSIGYDFMLAPKH